MWSQQLLTVFDIKEEKYYHSKHLQIVMAIPQTCHNLFMTHL